MSGYADCAKGNPPNITPEKLLRAMLLQVFYSIRSERQLMEQIRYNLLFHWFVGLATTNTDGKVCGGPRSTTKVL